MHFLLNTGYYKPSKFVGGPIYSVSALAEALVVRGHRVTVAAVRNPYDSRSSEVSHEYVLNGVNVRLFEPVPYLWQKLPIRRLREMSVSRLDRTWLPWLREIIPSVDVCDSQLGFLYSNRAVAQLTREFGKVHFYHQRGNLDPRRFGSNSIGKAMYLRFYEKQILESADALIALSQRETEVFRSYAPNSRIELIPNGIDLKEWQSPAEAEGALADAFERVGEAPLVVWHSRMVKMKGPDVFVRACAKAFKSCSSLRAIVAGPDGVGLRQTCEQLARDLGIDKYIDFLDALSGENRRALLQRADLFVLPTTGEGLSMAILEALACGCPIVTTPEANIPELQDHNAGVVVPLDESQIGAVMSEFFSSSKQDRMKMERNAVTLAGAKFSLPAVLDRYLALSEEIVGLG